MINERILRREIDRIENILRKYAYSQARRFFLKGDQESNAEDIYSKAYLSFISYFFREENQGEFIEIIENNILEQYLKTVIKNKASDMRDVQNHAPTDLRANPTQNDEGEYVDPLDILGDNNPNPDRVLNFRQILELLKKGLDEDEALIIHYKFEKNMTFEEISKILQINSNTLRTKVGLIRQRHSEYNDLTWDEDE
jgi:RNA polymerase sigma factor (sigma-70 family)